MSNIERFQAYADAFELTYEDDNWQRLEQYFTIDAIYVPGDGTEAVGRDKVLEQLRNNVDGLDRRFDSRRLQTAPPGSDGDTVSLSWQLTLSKAGAPDLSATGVEHASFTNGAISRLEDVFDEGVAENVGAWMAEHGPLLGS